MQDTIFAPLTIRGKCSVYLIRISGEKTLDCLRNLGVVKLPKDKRATLCKIKDKNSEVLDEALITFFKAPNSFTGEDVCEISLHCSNYIIDKVFKILLSLKEVRLAERGEFSKRAFLNNKLDLTQAEAINDLVNSQTELQHKQAIEQLVGKNSKFFENLKDRFVDLYGDLESQIDFPEDDVNEGDLVVIKNKIINLTGDIKGILNDNGAGEKIKNGLNISIIGEPNVGKSTFFNFLAGENVAIVSDTAGTTRDVLHISLNIGGVPVNFYDTAGIRKTTDAIEGEGVKRAIENAKNADLKILLLSADDNNFSDIFDIFRDILDENTLTILNKIDLVEDNKVNKIVDNLSKNIINKNIIALSLKEKINTSSIFKYLESYINKVITPYSGTSITQERYRVELIKAVKILENIDFSTPIELMAEQLRQASFCIGKITGHINTEDILNNIFGKFCIGK